MSLFTDLHQSYDSSTQLFADKQAAESVAGVIVRIISKRVPEFTPAMVRVTGKKKSYTIEIPRLQLHWCPGATDTLTLTATMAAIANIAKDTLQ